MKYQVTVTAKDLKTGDSELLVNNVELLPYNNTSKVAQGYIDVDCMHNFVTRNSIIDDDRILQNGIPTSIVDSEGNEVATIVRASFVYYDLVSKKIPSAEYVISVTRLPE